MIELLHSSFRLDYRAPEGNVVEIVQFRNLFNRDIPDYFQFALESEEIEFQHTGGNCFRIWGPAEAIKEYDSSEFQQWFPDAIPIGDDMGSDVIIYLPGLQGFGLYHCDWSVRDVRHSVWIARSLTDFLTRAVGVETFD
jgi:hypothetical protein